MKKLLVGLFILGCAGMAAKAEAAVTMGPSTTMPANIKGYP